MRKVAPRIEKSKFTVVVWEQRRFEMVVEADNKEAAEAEARNVWHHLGDNDISIEQVPEVKFCDNREIKFMIIDEVI